MEFALVFPIIALIIFGAIDFGRAAFAYSTIANAARTGARVAAVNQILNSPDCNESRPVEDVANPHWSIKACAANAADVLGVQPSSVTVSYSVPAGSSLTCSPTLRVGCTAHVTVNYSYSPLTPVISSAFPTIAMSSTSQMPIERVFP